MKGLSLVLAAAGGAIVGAAAALLLAPQKGSDTRYAIKKFVKSHCPALKNHQIEQIAEEIESGLSATK